MKRAGLSYRKRACTTLTMGSIYARKRGEAESSCRRRERGGTETIKSVGYKIVHAEALLFTRARTSCTVPERSTGIYNQHPTSGKTNHWFKGAPLFSFSPNFLVLRNH